MIQHGIPYRYLYWHQGLRAADPQQVLFAMDCTGRYIRTRRSGS